jgi:gluconokinase
MDGKSGSASTGPGEARRPLVLALDVGTSSVRALVYDAVGRAVEGAESRTAYEMKTTPHGGVEADGDTLLDLTCSTVDALIQAAGGTVRDICAVGSCTFWHSLVGVDAEGRAATPVFNWNDTRSRCDAAGLAERLGADWIHAQTGALPHSSYFPAKLLWLARTRPDSYRRVVRWMSFGEYLHLRIFGRTLCSVSMASGTGLLNPNTCSWNEEMLKESGISADHLSPLAADHEFLTGMTAEYAGRWPALARLPWLPALGDGACSNIGSGCVERDRVALMVGTSGAMRICWQADKVETPRGLWCYRADRRYALVGGALSNAGDVYAWWRNAFQLEEGGMEPALASLEPDGHGLTVLPFFSGERSTGWADNARAAVTGMSLDTRPIDIVRAAMEAVAYRFAAIYEQMSAVLGRAARIVASGGGILHSPVWTQMMADVIGAPVLASAVAEASSRGAALLALESLGFLTDFRAVPAPAAAVYDPDPPKTEIYGRGRRRQEALYSLLISPRSGC